MKYIGGTKLDERVIRTDLDEGFAEGRQYGYISIYQTHVSLRANVDLDEASPADKFVMSTGKSMILVGEDMAESSARNMARSDENRRKNHDICPIKERGYGYTRSTALGIRRMPFSLVSLVLGLYAPELAFDCQFPSIPYSAILPVK